MSVKDLILMFPAGVGIFRFRPMVDQLSGCLYHPLSPAASKAKNNQQCCIHTAATVFKEAVI